MLFCIAKYAIDNNIIMNFYLLLYPLVFFLLFISIKSKRKFPCYIVSLGLYLSTGIACIALYSMEDYKSSVSPEAILYHIIMLILLIVPIKHYDKFAYRNFEFISDKTLRPFTYLLIVISIFSIYISSENISFDRILTDVVGIRSELAENNVAENGIVGWITYYARIFWSVALVLMFYYIIYYPKQKALIFLLFISSLSQVVHSLTFAGRDIVLKYIFVFFILMLLFRFDLPKGTKKRLYKIFIVIILVFISFFILISLLRWDMNETAQLSTTESIIAYWGQPFLYFSGYYENFALKGATNGSIHFPIFTSTSMSRYALNDYVMSNINLNTFATSIGTWVFEIGALTASIVAIVHHFLMIGLKRKKKSIFTIIYITWVFEFTFFSLFYYIYTINLSFLASILFIKILEISSNYHK